MGQLRIFIHVISCEQGLRRPKMKHWPDWPLRTTLLLSTGTPWNPDAPHAHKIQSQWDDQLICRRTSFMKSLLPVSLCYLRDRYVTTIHHRCGGCERQQITISTAHIYIGYLVRGIVDFVVVCNCAPLNKYICKFAPSHFHIVFCFSVLIECNSVSTFQYVKL